MLRHPRVLRSLCRPLVRPYSSLPQHSGTFNVRHVRLVRPFFTKRRLMYALLWISAGSILVSTLVSTIEDDEEDGRPGQVTEAVRQVKKATEGEKLGPDGDVELDAEESKAEKVSEDEEDVVPDEQPDDSIFIPFGWPRERPREYYKASDPEWQLFVEFARDEKRKSHVKGQLEYFIHSHLSNDKNFKQALGTPITVGRVWLDIDYPYGPPQDFEQSGIEITDQYIAWVIRPVDAVNVGRLKHALAPTPLFWALWGSYRSLWDSGVMRVRKALDMEPSSKRFPPGFSLPQKEDTVSEPESKLTSSSKNTTPTKRDQSQLSRMLPPLPKPSEDYASASREFKKTLARNRSKQSMGMEPPRGTLVVSGLVELNGPKGACVFDTKSAYDPKSSQWMIISIGLRRIKEHKQTPKE